MQNENNCFRCNRFFDSKEKYDKHVKSNKCKEPYHCEKCNYTVNRKSSYNKHLNTKKCKLNDTNQNPVKFKCELCGVSFRDNYDLQRHLSKKTPCIAVGINTTINNGTINNNNTHNTNNGTVNNNNNNINLNVVLSNYGVDMKSLPKVEQFLLKKLKVAPNITDPKYLEAFKEDLEKELCTYSFEDEEEQKKDNTRILNKFFDKCIPREPKLKHSMPVFTSNMFEDVLIKDNDSIIALNIPVLQQLLLFLKNVSENNKEELQNSGHDFYSDYIIHHVEDKLVDIKYKINEFLMLMNNIYGCHLCTERFKSNTILQKHIRASH